MRRFIVTSRAIDSIIDAAQMMVVLNMVKVEPLGDEWYDEMVASGVLQEIEPDGAEEDSEEETNLC